MPNSDSQLWDSVVLVMSALRQLCARERKSLRNPAPKFEFLCERKRKRWLWVDAVDKVGGERGAGNNRLEAPRFLNQCCALGSYLESILLTLEKRFIDSIGHLAALAVLAQYSATRSSPSIQPASPGLSLYWS